MLTTADAVKILKEVYGEGPASQLNNEVRELKHFEKSKTAKWNGKVWVDTIEVNRNHSTKAVAEGGILPDNVDEEWNDLRIPNRYVYGEVAFTAQLMYEATGKGAFVDAADKKINSMTQDMRVELNRMVWGAGKGVLALVNETNSDDDTTTLVDAPGGVAGAINGARFIKKNMVISFHAASPTADGLGGPSTAVRTVTAVAADGTEITVNEAINDTEAPPNGLITKGVTYAGTNQGSFEIEPMGILGLIDDGTYRQVIHGLDRSLEPSFVPVVFDNVGSLDEIIFWRALDGCDELSGREPNWFACHHSIHREYIEVTLGDKRYSGDSLMRPDAGIKGGGKKHELTFSGTPIEKCRYAPYGQFFGIDDTALRRYTNRGEGEWISEDGSRLERIARTDAFHASYRKWCNYSIMRCNSSFVLRGINATVDVWNSN